MIWSRLKSQPNRDNTQSASKGMHFFDDAGFLKAMSSTSPSPVDQSPTKFSPTPMSSTTTTPVGSPNKRAQRYIRVFDKEHRTTVFDLVILFIDLKRAAMNNPGLIDGEVRLIMNCTVSTANSC